MASYLLLIVFPLALLFAAIWDLTTMTIPNVLTLALAGAFLVLVPFTGTSMGGIGMHLAAGLLMLLVGMGFFAMGWMGGGDAKLVAAVALWLGWSELLPYLLYASIFGGVLTLMILGFRRLPLPLFLARQDWIRTLYDRRTGIPYGLALAAAGLLIYPDTVWFKLAATAS
ncbi:MAG: peptidase [Rhizobiales bacterium]|nr:peptidase [Hyphomicrobiales bacterium]